MHSECSLSIQQIYRLSFRHLSNVTRPYVPYSIKPARLPSGTPKKTTFFDDIIKNKKFIPGPNAHSINFNFGFKKRSNSLPTYKFNPKKSKQKRIPGVGNYNLQRYFDKFKKKGLSKKASVNRRFLDSVAYDASKIPGVGSYNISKSLQNNIGKMRSKSLGKVKQLNQQSVLNPIPQSYRSFIGMEKQKKNKYQHSAFWLSEKRFKENNQFPAIGPGKYRVFIDWGKKKNWYDSLWKGREQSVYH